ncbi:MAG TPA: PHP domain-containing protein [Anaeromyxobacteraceae bacterium]|nr:PHP domain-containing protein [Anaeromyxobacteraceae bacterium]
MAGAAGVIDLHTHSTASDGQYTPADIAGRAAAAGTSVWALTDHDTVAGLEPAALEARRLGMRFVPGIELSVYLDQREIHVLGHFVDPAHPTLGRFEDFLAERRRERMEQIIEKLAALGIRIAADDIVRFSGGKTIGRPHVARALVAAGAVETVKEAFDRYLAEGKPAYVGRYRLIAEDAVSLVRGAGGVATLAHPGVSKIERGDLLRLRGMGFDGVEVYHPDHVPSQLEKYGRAAAELDLVATAGSDFHGEAVAPDRSLGTTTMPLEDLERLERRRR